MRVVAVAAVDGVVAVAAVELVDAGSAGDRVVFRRAVDRGHDRRCQGVERDGLGRFAVRMIDLDALDIPQHVGAAIGGGDRHRAVRVADGRDVPGTGAVVDRDIEPVAAVDLVVAGAAGEDVVAEVRCR